MENNDKTTTYFYRPIFLVPVSRLIGMLAVVWAAGVLLWFVFDKNPIGFWVFGGVCAAVVVGLCVLFAKRNVCAPCNILLYCVTSLCCSVMLMVAVWGVLSGRGRELALLSYLFTGLYVMAGVFLLWYTRKMYRRALAGESQEAPANRGQIAAFGTIGGAIGIAIVRVVSTLPYAFTTGFFIGFVLLSAAVGGLGAIIGCGKALYWLKEVK